jgi:hypothetical protein
MFNNIFTFIIYHVKFNVVFFSILEYNMGILGIRIIFSDHKTPELILKCDTVKSFLY